MMLKILQFLFPALVWQYKTDEKKVYLSFDDGPIPESTTWTLNLLKEKNVKANFFCVGDNVKRHPQLYAEILKAGHAVGNHTHNHIKAWKYGAKNYVNNVKLASKYIDSKLFRPPYGILTPLQIKILKKNYSIIMNSVVSGDHRKNKTPEQIYRNVLKKIKSGSIILFHNHPKSEANMRYVLPKLIDELHQKGYKFELCN